MSKRGWSMKDYAGERKKTELEQLLPPGWVLKHPKDRKDPNKRYWKAESEDWEVSITSAYFQNLLFRVYSIALFGEDIPDELLGGTRATSRNRKALARGLGRNGDESDGESDRMRIPEGKRLRNRRGEWVLEDEG